MHCRKIPIGMCDSNMQTCPSHLSYSTSCSSSLSSSSSDDELQLMVHLETIDAEQKAIVRHHANNRNLIAQYLIQQNNQVTHGSLIPGHIVINRDRESADRNFFNDYFAKNPRYNNLMFRRRF
ncbi:hypothetical protein ACOSQ2_017122 [Xanthoceras sorbifolium]